LVNFFVALRMQPPSGMLAHPSLELASNLAFQTINYLFDRAQIPLYSTIWQVPGQIIM